MSKVRLSLFGLSVCFLSLLVSTPDLAIAANSSLDALSRPAMQSSKSSHHLMNSVVSAGKRLVACGERGIVMLSDDAGNSWRQSKSVPVSVTLTRILFLDEKTGWAVGHGGVVLGTTDGGESWQLLLDGVRAANLEGAAAEADTGNVERQKNAARLIKDGADKPFFGLHFTDTLSGMVVGAYGLVFATEDGGKTWKSAIERIENSKGNHLYSIYSSGADLYVVGEQGTFYRSSDNGGKFKRVEMPTKGTLFGVVATNGGQLLAYGLRGNLYRKEVGSDQWEKINVPPITLTLGITLKDGSIILADEVGHLLKSTDEGRSFQSIPQSQSVPIVGLTQAEDGSLILAGLHDLKRLVITKSSTESKK